MKKTYRQPSVMVEEAVPLTFICGSMDVTSSNDEINYGGVDVEGTKDPAVRRQRDVWEDEELEDEEVF